MIKQRFLVTLLASTLCFGAAHAQTSPGFTTGQTLSSTALNAAFANKADLAALTTEAATARANEAAALSAALAAQSTTSGLVNVEKQFYADPGLVAQYLLTEGSGTTLNDSSGHGCNVSFASMSSLPAWSPDSALKWSGGLTPPMPLPSCVTGVQTIEVVINKGVSTAGAGFNPVPFYNEPISYNTSSTGNGITLHFDTAYSSVSGGNQGTGTKWPGLDQNNVATPYSYGTPIDNGAHDLIIVADNTNKTMALYLDGVKLTNSLNGLYPSYPTTNDLSSVTWDFGGGQCGVIANCGYTSQIVAARFSSSVLTPAQVLQDHNAFVALEKYKGTINNPNYLTVSTTGLIEGEGESTSWGHGLALSYQQNFEVYAAADINAGLAGANFTGVQNGNDNKTGYLMSNECPVLYNATASTGGYKVAVLFDKENGELLGSDSGASLSTGFGAGWPSSIVANQTVAGITLADIAGLSACARSIKSSGWLTVYSTSEAAGSGTSPTTVKDITNPLRRLYAPALFDAVWDPANDARFGADSASINNSTGSVGCSGGPTFQGDLTHPTPCGQQVLGYQLAAVIADMMLAINPATGTISAASYLMTLNDLGANYALSASGASFTLLPCGGLIRGTKMVQLTNASASADTIAASVEYNAGAQDLINGAATYSLPAGATRTFRTTFLGDNTGGCGFLAQ